MVVHPSVAHAVSDEYTDGWLYKSSDSDCAWYYDEEIAAPGYNWYVEVEAYLAYTYFGMYTATCYSEWNRPPGNLAVDSYWYSNTVENPSTATECAYSPNWVYNSSTAYALQVYWANNTISQYCHNYVYDYTGNFEYNGAWHGGWVYPGSWNY